MKKSYMWSFHHKDCNPMALWMFVLCVGLLLLYIWWWTNLVQKKSWICSQKKFIEKVLDLVTHWWWWLAYISRRIPSKLNVRSTPDQTKLLTLFRFLTIITPFRFHMKDFVTSARKKFKSKSKSVTSWQCQDFERLG